MILLTTLLLLAAIALCAVGFGLRAAAKKTRQPARAESAASTSPDHPKSKRRVPNVRQPEPAVARTINGRRAHQASSATTPADPKAAAVRVLICADTANHARNLIQHAAQPARR